MVLGVKILKDFRALNLVSHNEQRNIFCIHVLALVHTQSTIYTSSILVSK